MNYQENKEFVKYYIENVIEDLRPTILTLMSEQIIETKYYVIEILETSYYKSISAPKEITKDEPRPEYIYKNTSNGDEQKIKFHYYDNIEKRPKYKSEEIFYEFLGMINKVEWERFKTIINYKNKVESRFALECLRKPDHIMELFERKYEQYFRDEQRRLRNIERKKRKELKNKI